MRDISNCWLPITLRLMEDVLEVVEELFFYILMVLKLFPLIVIKDGNMIVHVPLNGGTVKEFGFLLPFFEPSNS